LNFPFSLSHTHTHTLTLSLFLSLEIPKGNFEHQRIIQTISLSQCQVKSTMCPSLIPCKSRGQSLALLWSLKPTFLGSGEIVCIYRLSLWRGDRCRSMQSVVGSNPEIRTPTHKYKQSLSLSLSPTLSKLSLRITIKINRHPEKSILL
jgi:hypothetical protein